MHILLILMQLDFFYVLMQIVDGRCIASFLPVLIVLLIFNNNIMNYSRLERQTPPIPAFITQYNRPQC